MGKILIADDDREIAELISDSLSDEGYECLLAFDGESALTSIKNDSEIALIILDIMMPDVDGLEICRRIRETVSCPILFVTAKSRTFDAMLGFEMGADDYITKPFVVEELVARVKAHLRRERRSRQAKPALLEAGDVCLNVESYDVTVRGEPVNLSLAGIPASALSLRERGKGAFAGADFPVGVGNGLRRYRYGGRQHQKPAG